MARQLALMRASFALHRLGHTQAPALTTRALAPTLGLRAALRASQQHSLRPAASVSSPAAMAEVLPKVNAAQTAVRGAVRGARCEPSRLDTRLPPSLTQRTCVYVPAAQVNVRIPAGDGLMAITLVAAGKQRNLNRCDARQCSFIHTRPLSRVACTYPAVRC